MLYYGARDPFDRSEAISMSTNSGSDILERMEVRELIEKWVLYRDAADWENFRSLWADDGRMIATWFSGPAEEFIKVSIEGVDHGTYILHFLGGSIVDIEGDRAVAQTKMTIAQRGEVHGVECDIVGTGRFYDLIERRDGDWRIVLRQPIYERDHMTPVEPSQSLTLDSEILARYPVGYQHLAYFLQGRGYDVKRDMPGLSGPRLEALYAHGAAWLEGKPDNWDR